ncbi:pyrroloquinoline quinone biosynthesis protein PqqB [Pelomonas sp. Root1217]|uniref:pyrroloquinoline quinone biosynthesis protein PqqB n=1 Tax=Pelomonas sp. Root1217 TaxID=1736430 RepID=UPI000710327C|nr:pyrroloquinoline quinone biosynthesis protein PqqB [Pelomonas sp. Root1217]KQV50508.1 pyrroloquinoline quinone biosynthesis protein PqqB [Pelomonas sp. Root1217]
MKLLVLGSGAGGGFPLWNCHCRLCSSWRRGELDASARTQSAIAISQDGRPGEGWLLINASPDLPQQIRATPALQPVHAGDMPIRAVVLLDSRLHHVAGLLSLRESRELEVYATPLVFEDLTAELPLLHVLESYCRVRWRMLPIAGDVRSAAFEIPGFPALSFAAVAVPARAPRHARLRSEAAGECIALQVQDLRTGRRVFLSPALAEVGEAELAWMRQADCVVVDGSFWTEHGMQEAGIGSVSASDKGHLPQSRHGERPGMIDALQASGAPRKVLTHIHHSNPILDRRGAQRRELLAHGIEVAHDGMEIEL